MDAINQQSKTSIHFGISFVLAMPWAIDKSKSLQFQQALLDYGLDFPRTNLAGNRFEISRNEPSPLRVVIEANGPQVSSLHIVSQKPSYDLDMFVMDAEQVCSAFQKTWPAPQYQLIRQAAKIHHLYSCSTHAFGYLWEKRLGQSPDDFKCLGGRPVAGGGLRLVIPPHTRQDVEPHSIELRIESYMQETTRLFIETAMVWPKPKFIKADDKFDPQTLLEQVEHYATNEVWNFLTQ